jgi:O-antigen/teichoic acid export membrane protein
MNSAAHEFHSVGGFSRFYAPLAATGLLLTATNPILTATVARSDDPIAVLAGFTVAFSLCGVLYSPLLVIQQVAATRLLEGGDLAPVRRFATLLGVALSVVAVVIAFAAPATEMIFHTLMGLEGRAFEEAVGALRVLWPLPILTAIKATHQGRLVAGHRTRPIAQATAVRTIGLAVTAFALAAWSGGAWVGGVAFTVGVTIETGLLALAATPGLRDVRPTLGVEPEELGALLLFSWPLIVNVVLWWATPLIINAILARTQTPHLNIAAFAIVEAVAWFITSPVGQLQHASIALVDCPESHARVRPMAVSVAVTMFLVLVVASVAAVRVPILSLVYGGASPELLMAAGAAFPVAALYPLLYGHRQYYQGLFIRANHPTTVGAGAILRVLSIAIGAVLLLKTQGHHGALFGVALAVGGLGVEGIFLERLSHRQALPSLRALSTITQEAMSSSAEGGLA